MVGTLRGGGVSTTTEVFSDYVCPFCYLAEQLARLINGSPSQGPRPLR
jgi:protein-disulfide isomerase